jgi:hypothetical protein
MNKEQWTETLKLVTEHVGHLSHVQGVVLFTSLEVADPNLPPRQLADRLVPALWVVEHFAREQQK